MKLFKIFVTIFLFLSIFVNSSVSKIIMLPLYQMVNDSEIIFIGKVININKFYNSNIENSYKQVVVHNEETIKGTISTKNITIYSTAFITTEPPFVVGEKAIFFIKKWNSQFTLVQGYAGKVAIQNDIAKPQYILNEDKVQKTQDFIQKIRKIIKNTGVRH